MTETAEALLSMTNRKTVDPDALPACWSSSSTMTTTPR